MIGWILLGLVGWAVIAIVLVAGTMKISSECSRAEEERERTRRRRESMHVVK